MKRDHKRAEQQYKIVLRIIRFFNNKPQKNKPLSLKDKGLLKDTLIVAKSLIMLLLRGPA